MLTFQYDFQIPVTAPECLGYHCVGDKDDIAINLEENWNGQRVVSEKGSSTST